MKNPVINITTKTFIKVLFLSLLLILNNSQLFPQEQKDSINLIDKQIENKNCQCLSANISKPGISDLQKVCTFNQNFNSLISKLLGNPCLLISANRYASC